MAKLLPLLTAAAMIGVVGGVVLWLIVAREGVVPEAGRAPIPADYPGESRSSDSSSGPATKSAGPSVGSVVEALIAPSQNGTSPAPTPSEATFSPTVADPVEPTDAARGSAPVPPPFGKAPLPQAAGGIDAALTFALEAADPYVKEGFTVREDYWGGDLPVKQPRAIVHQLFKGNNYWFWMGTAQDGAKIAVHVYDSDGRLVEAESWQKPHKAAAMIVPKKTGTYYMIVEVERSPEERTPWAMVYGFR
ncbi:MAG TPA: hypothetical protein VGO11_22090 [Chthoniobacteraceae bacterium]|jgi:hypothetical protein|nr:hypothetical protein [Chthoniobacteraceae bacterium]